MIPRTGVLLDGRYELTRRIAVSVALILLVALGIYTGVIKPHGIGG